MPLPPALLERLKRRKIIQEVLPKDVTPSSSEVLSKSITTKSLNESGSDHDLARAELAGVIKDEHEEILAEDYSDEDKDSEELLNDDYDNTDPELGEETNSDGDDDESNKNLLSSSALSHERPDGGLLQSESTHLIESVLGCPNKYNIHHKCSQYCIDNYSNPSNLKPTLEQRRQLASILRTFPLPNDWTIVYDPGVRTFYFWNTLNNQVSWYPPTWGVGFASRPADEFRR